MAAALAGKVALVTGAARGIGRATARKLAAEGCDVAVNYYNSAEAAESLCAEIRGLGRRAMAIQGSVGIPESVDEMFAELARHFDRLDIVVSNAATGVLRPALELTRKHWQTTMDTNAFALLALARRAAPTMGEGGRVIALSSLGASRAIPDYAAVGASKAALEALVRQLGAELAPRGITVNAIRAGVVETEALDFFPAREAILEASRARTPSHRLVTAEEVADAALFLASPLARAVTGQVLVVDNGYSVVG